MSENPNRDNGPAGTYDFGDQFVIIKNLIGGGSIIAGESEGGTEVKLGKATFYTKSPWLDIKSDGATKQVKFSLTEPINLKWYADTNRTYPDGVETAFTMDNWFIEVAYTAPTFPRTSFTCPYDGIYLVTASLAVLTNAGVSAAALRIYKDGDRQSTFRVPAIAALSRATLECTTIIDARSGQTISATLQPTGEDLEVTGGIDVSSLSISMIAANQLP